MKSLKKLTIYEIYEEALGKDKADLFFEKLSDGLEGKKGAALKRHIFSILCELKITDIEIFEISNTLVQVITKQVSPKS